jgi:O-antigen/teichoic acid export membrane protein
MASTGEIGRFSIALGIASVMLLFSDLGLGPGAVVRYVPFLAGAQEFNRVRSVMKISIVAGTVFSIFCMILLFLFSGTLAGFFKDSLLTQVLYVMTFYLLAYNFYSIAVSFLSGRKLMKASNQVGNIQALSKLLITAALLFLFGASAVNISLGFVLSFLLAAVVGCYWAYGEYRRLPVSDEKTEGFALLKEMVPFGLTLVFISSLSLVNSYFDRIMIGGLLPETVNLYVSGIYFVVVGFSSLIIIFSGTFQSIYFPLISEAVGRKDYVSLQETSATFIRWIISFTMPLMLVILVFPKEILTIIYGSNYGEGSMALILYSIGSFFSLFSWPIYYVLSAMKKLKAAVLITILSAILNLLLNLLLIPAYGIDGAAFASSVSIVISTGIFLLIRKRAYFSIPGEIYKPFAAGSVTVAILLGFKYFYNYPSWMILEMPISGDIWSDITRKLIKVLVLGVFCIITTMVYALFLLALRSFHQEDVDIITGGMRRVGLPEDSINFVGKVLTRKL